jgi:hypothetical protein
VQIGPAPPMRTDITFQTIIRGWSRPQQLHVLKKKLWDLGLLRLRISPELIPLVDDYRHVLQAYYKQRSDAPKEGPLSDKSIGPTLSRLDALDVQRAKMQPQIQAPVAAVTAP